MPSFQTLLPTIQEAKTKSSSNHQEVVGPVQTSIWPLCDGTSLLLRQKQSSTQSPKPLPFHGKLRTTISGPNG